jgi:hypothetical protein
MGVIQEYSIEMGDRLLNPSIRRRLLKELNTG